MKTFFKSLLVALIILSIISIVYLQFKLPRQKGINSDLTQVLNSNVDVYYDDYGIPHITAETSSDAYHTFGYVFASQRLFQMDIYRRVVSGRLSEIFGKKTLDSDILMRNLKIKSKSRAQLENPNLSTEAKNVMKSFLAGIHYFIDNGNLPVEFELLGYRPEKFTMLDIVSISGYLALSFNEGMNSDILNSQLSKTLPSDKLDVLRDNKNIDSKYQSSPKSVYLNLIKKVDKSLKVIDEVLPLFHGSNSWVLSGKRTQSGKPILANDPHIATSNPHVFFEAHLKYEDFEVYGNFLPLIPFPVMGHTPYSVWGLTMAEVDDLNLYEEKLNSEDDSKVMFKGEWVDFISNTERVKIKNEEDYIFEVFESPHGPILNSSKYPEYDSALSVSWSLYHPDNNLIQALYELPKARNVDELKIATSKGAAPPLNITWANTSGDIAWWVMGMFPKLPDGVASDVILNGYSGNNEIERFYTIEENPHSINPESGIIVSANFRPQGDEFAHFSGYWQPGGRYFRIMELLEKQEKWSSDDLKMIQTDLKVPFVKQQIEKLIKFIHKDKLDQDEISILNSLVEWDGNTNKSSYEPSIYYSLSYKLVKNIFYDEMGDELYKVFGKTANFWQSYKKVLYEDSNFWDDITTDRVESRKDIITKTFKTVVLELKDKFGNNYKLWRWGRLHSTEYIHPLGRIKPLNYIFNIGPIESHGGKYVINNLGHVKYKNNFKVVSGPATRRIIDLANPRSSLGIFPTGNSANFMSDHFKDQLRLYHNNQYRLQDMNWSNIKKYPVLKFIKEDNH